MEAFANENGLVHALPELRKGAIIAQNPSEFETMPEITDEEKEHLRNEVLHKWRHPKALFLTIVVCSIGAAVQGWDQTGSNGANLSFPKEFGIGEGENEGHPNMDRDNWLVGLVNAAPYLGSSLLYEIPRLWRAHRF